jgi:hypothetical protein
MPAGVDLTADVREPVTLYRAGKPLGYDMCKADKVYQYNTDKPAEFVSSPAISLACEDCGRKGATLLRATVDSGETVSRVVFYVNSRKAGEARIAPYSAVVTLPIGDIVAYARVFTKSGQHTTSAPLTLSNFQRK